VSSSDCHAPIMQRLGPHQDDAYRPSISHFASTKSASQRPAQIVFAGNPCLRATTIDHVKMNRGPSVTAGPLEAAITCYKNTITTRNSVQFLAASPQSLLSQDLPIHALVIYQNAFSFLLGAQHPLCFRPGRSSEEASWMFQLHHHQHPWHG
jgi:hypothetical protein